MLNCMLLPRVFVNGPQCSLLPGNNILASDSFVTTFLIVVVSVESVLHRGPAVPMEKDFLTILDWYSELY